MVIGVSCVGIVLYLITYLFASLYTQGDVINSVTNCIDAWLGKNIHALYTLTLITVVHFLGNFTKTHFFIRSHQMNKRRESPITISQQNVRMVKLHTFPIAYNLEQKMNGVIFKTYLMVQSFQSRENLTIASNYGISLTLAINVRYSISCYNELQVYSKSTAFFRQVSPDTKVHGADMGPTWVLSAPDGPHDGPVNLSFRVTVYLWGPGLYTTLTKIRSESMTVLSLWAIVRTVQSSNLSLMVFWSRLSVLQIKANSFMYKS